MEELLQAKYGQQICITNIEEYINLTTFSMSSQNSGLSSEFVEALFWNSHLVETLCY